MEREESANPAAVVPVSESDLNDPSTKRAHYRDLRKIRSKW